MMQRFGTTFLILLSTLSCHHKDPTEINPEPSAIERSWPMMGTVFSIQIWNQNAHALSRAMEAAFAAVSAVDREMSTYKPESGVSKINQQAGEPMPVSVSAETLEVIRAAISIGKESGGAFDITAGSLVSLWSFYSPWKGEERRPPLVSEIIKARKLLGLNQVWLDSNRTLVRLEKRGMKLDLGGIAKGFALDRAAEILNRESINSALLDIGGQVLVVGRPPDGNEWRIGIRNPENAAQTIGVILVDHGSVATSGGSERFFMYRGKRYAHILDPRTGWPVDHTKSVTVWAPTGLMADAWSTALFVAGYDKGKELMKKQPELGAVWIDSKGAHVEGTLLGKVGEIVL